MLGTARGRVGDVLFSRCRGDAAVRVAREPRGLRGAQARAVSKLLEKGQAGMEAEVS